MAIQSFKAICDEKTHTIILGTMPGVASLGAHQYYAHKRNALWPIVIAGIKNVPVDYALHGQYSYEQKIMLLKQAGFGLWDVLAECERAGSLDSRIQAETVIVNDFSVLIDRCSRLSALVFNGKTAHRLFFRHVKPQLEGLNYSVDNHAIKSIVDNRVSISLCTMPSTSPAMASITLEQKSAQWQTVLF